MFCELEGQHLVWDCQLHIQTACQMPNHPVYCLPLERVITASIVKNYQYKLKGVSIHVHVYMYITNECKIQLTTVTMSRISTKSRSYMLELECFVHGCATPTIIFTV